MRHAAPQVCLLALGVAPPPARGVLRFFGKCGAASAFQLAYIYPTELFPTAVRTSAFGVANVAGRPGHPAPPLPSPRL